MRTVLNGFYRHDYVFPGFVVKEHAEEYHLSTHFPDGLDISGVRENTRDSPTPASHAQESVSTPIFHTLLYDSVTFAGRLVAMTKVDKVASCPKCTASSPSPVSRACRSHWPLATRPVRPRPSGLLRFSLLGSHPSNLVTTSRPVAASRLVPPPGCCRGEQWGGREVRICRSIVPILGPRNRSLVRDRESRRCLWGTENPMSHVQRRASPLAPARPSQLVFFGAQQACTLDGLCLMRHPGQTCWDVRSDAMRGREPVRGRRALRFMSSPGRLARSEYGKTATFGVLGDQHGMQ